MTYELDSPAFFTVSLPDGSGVEIDLIEAYMEISLAQAKIKTDKIVATGAEIKPWLEDKLGFAEGGMKLNQAAGLVGKIVDEGNPIMEGLKKKHSTTAS